MLEGVAAGQGRQRNDRIGELLSAGRLIVAITQMVVNREGA